jgi:hypothetical protein
MNDENNSEIKQPKVSALIITSVFSNIAGISILIIKTNFYHPWWNEYIARNLVLLFGMIGVITGYIAVKRIYERKRYSPLGIIILFLLLQFLLNFIFDPYGSSLYSHRWACIYYASMACLICLLLFPVINSMNRWVYGTKIGAFKIDIFVYSGITVGLFLYSVWLIETHGPIQISLGMGCGLHLEKLGKAISIYSKENNVKYPDPNIWYELLLKDRLIEKDDFICPEVKFRWERQLLPFPIPINRKSYYAINPNCEPNSPPDMVLLFETKGGWNLAGGMELLTAENHRGVCFVLLNDGSLERIYKTEQFAALKWNTGEKK